MEDLKFQFISTRETVRGNVTNDHVTVMITSAVGSFLPPYLLFSGEDSSVVPSFIDENKENIWGTFSPAGWMDSERFQVFTLKLLDELRKKLEICDPTLPMEEYHLLIVDGHNSCLEPPTLLNCAANRLLILCGPSNDAGVNKAFKENLGKIAANHIEAHLKFSSSDVV